MATRERERERTGSGSRERERQRQRQRRWKPGHNTVYKHKLKCEYIILEADGMYMYNVYMSIHLLSTVIYTYLPFYQGSYKQLGDGFGGCRRLPLCPAGWTSRYPATDCSRSLQILFCDDTHGDDSAGDEPVREASVGGRCRCKVGGCDGGGHLGIPGVRSAHEDQQTAATPSILEH